MVVKSRREQHLRSLYAPLSLQVCLISPLHFLYCFPCSQSFNSGTVAAATADDNLVRGMVLKAVPKKTTRSPIHTLLFTLIRPTAQ